MAKRAKTKAAASPKAQVTTKKSAGRTVKKKKVGSSGESASNKKTSEKKAAKKTTRAKSAAKKTVAPKSTRKKAPSPSPKCTTSKVKKKSSATAKTKRSAPKQPASSQDPIQFIEEMPLPQTHLNDKQLAEFKQLLLDKHRQMASDVRDLSRDAGTQKAQGGADHSTMPIHMADLGTDNWEQEFTLGLIANEQGRIREIEEALVRIANRSYGICVATRRRISLARLRAKPWAKYCIDYARAREEGRNR